MAVEAMHGGEAPPLAELATAADRLRELPGRRIAEAWMAAVEELRAPSSNLHRRLDRQLAASSGLRPALLQRSLEALVVRHDAVSVGAVILGTKPQRRGLVTAVLAGNIPGLALEPMLAALAARRPLLIRSSSREPDFAPAWVGAMARHDPEVAAATACVAAGDEPLSRALQAAATVVVYGSDETLGRFSSRVGPGTDVIGYGAKASLSILLHPRRFGDDAAARLADDIVLFEQRGCLSSQAVVCWPRPRPSADGEAALRRVARRLAAALERKARELPAAAPAPEHQARLRQIRLEATMRDALFSAGAPGDGTVVLAGDHTLEPSPGLRTVRLHRVADDAALGALLEPWRHRLQGVSTDAADDPRLRQMLGGLAVHRITPLGELQQTPPDWPNEGFSLADRLAER